MFSSLVPELQILVLEAIADNSIGKKGAAHGYPLSRCASVCKGWQQFFEKVNFRQLVLSCGDIEYFEQLFKRRGGLFYLVQHIWFRIELLRYGCDDCKIGEPPSLMAMVGIAYLSPSYLTANDSVRMKLPQPIKSSVFFGFYHDWNVRLS